MANRIRSTPRPTPAFALNAARTLGRGADTGRRARQGRRAGAGVRGDADAADGAQMRKSMLDESRGAGRLRRRDDAARPSTSSSSRLPRASRAASGSARFMTRTLDGRSSEARRRRQRAAERPSSFALPPTAPASMPAAASAARRPRASRSADTADVPTSVDLPLDDAVTSAFGWRSRPVHRASRASTAASTCAPPTAPRFRPPAAARSYLPANVAAYGNLVVVAHASGVETRYAHLSSTLVKRATSVAAGHADRSRRVAAADPRHRTCTSKCWSTANESIPPQCGGSCRERTIKVRWRAVD